MSALRSLKTVLWAMLGIRKKSEYEEDLGRVSPFHVVAVGLVVLAVFVGGLVAVVHWVVKN
ncbi:MAG TPA: DUF2970 domain-containing protein [Myxococcota bacterium]|nr:DUF2970 domain-containing protein [Myxococcota bacterium]